MTLVNVRLAKTKLNRMGAKYCRINGFKGIVLSKKRVSTVRKYCSKGTLNSDKLLKAGAGVH